ncbi:MAG TPA: hypothetical protein VMW91_06590 [Desulfosporosinus sp.]|nr:hypothetical protein [Desulfosporosinus sp.]
MNANELHVHQSFQGAFLRGWLKRFSLQFHFIHGLGMRRGLVTTTERGIASMSAGDEALRNAFGLSKTRTGRSRLEHRHGWLDAVMD